MKCPKCLFCECDAVFDFGIGNLICSSCLEDRILRIVRLENGSLNKVAPGQHHPGTSAAATLSQVPNLGVVAGDPPFDPPFFRRHLIRKIS